MLQSDDAPDRTSGSSTQGDGGVDLHESSKTPNWPRRQLRRLSRWREGVRSNPSTRTMYRIVVLAIGATVTVVGLALVPLPGPGWVIVFVGLRILASESERAERLLDFAKKRLTEWTDWLGDQSLIVKALVGLLTAAFVACLFWALLAYYGVPGFVPESLVPPLPGLT